MALAFQRPNLKTFSNPIAPKSLVLANAEAHQKADRYAQGFGYGDQDNFTKGCAVGCTLSDFGGEPANHKDYETLFGIPEIIASLEDHIFENLPKKEAMKFPVDFIKAIPEGANLDKVWPQLAIWILKDENYGVYQYANEKTKLIIDKIADFYERILGEENVDVEELKKIFDAADADKAAVNAAVRAADAAAYAANAAYAAQAVYAASQAAYAAYAAAYAAANAAANAADADKAAYAAYAAKAANAADASQAAYAVKASQAAYAVKAACASRKTYYTALSKKLIQLLKKAH